MKARDFVLIFSFTLLVSPGWTYTEDEITSDMRKQDYESGLAVVKEEESKHSGGLGYLRIWNFTAPDSTPIAIVARRKSTDAAQPLVISYSLMPGGIQRYRRLPVGEYELSVYPSIQLDFSSPESADKPIDFSQLKKLANPSSVKIIKDDCATLLISGQGSKPEVKIIDETPKEGSGIQVYQMVPGINATIGVARRDGEEILMDKIEVGTFFVSWPSSGGRHPFFINYPNEFGTLGRRDFEIDFNFSTNHSVIIHKDAYGRVTSTATEDGLKAALAAQ
jgi:hypothetical protein